MHLRRALAGRAAEIESHEDNYLLSYHQLRRQNIDMKLRNSLSGLKDKVKQRLKRSKPKSDKTGADVGGSRSDSKGSLPGAEPHVVAGGSHDQEGDGANADGGQVHSTIRLPQQGGPGSVPTHRSVNDQERREADVDEGEVEQAQSRLHSVDVEAVDGGGPAEWKDIDEKADRVYPSPSTTLFSHDWKSDST